MDHLRPPSDLNEWLAAGPAHVRRWKGIFLPESLVRMKRGSWARVWWSCQLAAEVVPVSAGSAMRSAWDSTERWLINLWKPSDG
jgi:hypothetical protein